MGRGSFGEVWSASYRGQAVAVKLFLSTDDVSSEVALLSRASAAGARIDEARD